eukprot:2005609-Amphidinium_carterae.1
MAATDAGGKQHYHLKEEPYQFVQEFKTLMTKAATKLGAKFLNFQAAFLPLQSGTYKQWVCSKGGFRLGLLCVFSKKFLVMSSGLQDILFAVRVSLTLMRYRPTPPSRETHSRKLSRLFP